MKKKMTLQTLSDAQRKTQALLDAHIGGRNKAHATATSELSGFLSYADKSVIDQRGRRATGLIADNTYDILLLDIGFYVGRLFTNAPNGSDTSMALIEVTGWGDYRQYKFTRMTDGKTWTRTIYTDQNDTGWNDLEWISATIMNGFTGRCVVHRIDNNGRANVELRMNLTGSLELTTPIDIATLPMGHTSLDPNPIYFVGTGGVDNGSIPVGLYVHGGNKLGVYRIDDGHQTITTIRGAINFERSDSTV